MILKEVLEMLASECAKAGGNAAWCRSVEEKRGFRISPGYVSDVLKERYEPGPKLLDALGLERNEVTYRRKQGE